MTATVKAADLPVGSVVANQRTAWIKNEMNLGLDQENWSSTTGQTFTDYEITDYLRGEVLVDRHGATIVLREGP